MYSNILTYYTFAKLSFIRQNVYKTANWAGLFTNIFFMFFRGALFESIYTHSETIGGLTITNTLSYICISQAILMVVPQWGFLGVEEDIRSGQIAIYLSRPVNYFYSILFKKLGTSLFYLFYRTLPLMAIGAWAGFLNLNFSLLNILSFIISLFLAAWIAITLNFLVEVSAFWLESSRGLKMLMMGFLNFMSGLVIPIAFFPDNFKKISSYLPFEHTLNSPTMILIGNNTNIFKTLMLQFCWVIMLTIVSSKIFTIGENKAAINGG